VRPPNTPLQEALEKLETKAPQSQPIRLNSYRVYFGEAGNQGASFGGDAPPNHNTQNTTITAKAAKKKATACLTSESANYGIFKTSCNTRFTSIKAFSCFGELSK